MLSHDSGLGSYPVVLAEGEGVGLRLWIEEMSLFGFAQAADHNVIVVGGQNSAPRSTLHLQCSFIFLFFFETERKARTAVGQLRNGFRKRSGPSSAATKSAQSGREHSIRCSICMSQEAGSRQPKANGNNVIASRVVRRDGSRGRMPLPAARPGRVLVAIVVLFWGLFPL